MKKLLLILIALISINATASAQLSQAYSDRLDVVFDSVCQRFNIKGVSSAIIVPNEGTWKRTYGVSHGTTPITPDMYMGIGSNTKTYVAVLMLKLQEQGKLDLDDTIGQWIQHPNIPGNITIRQMLNHTSGLYSYTSNSDINNYILPDFTRIWPADSVLNLVKAPVSAPGGAWDYCNTNYLLAGMIISKVTGKPFEKALRDELLTPHGLSETYFYPQETVPGTIPHSWSRNLSGTQHEDLIAVHNYSHNAMFSLASSAGAIMATAEDNAKFWTKLQAGELLSSSSMAEMKTYVSLGLGQGYGLGVFNFKLFNGTEVISHGGTNIGFINDNVCDVTTGVSVTALTNQDSISNGIILNNLVRALHAVTVKYTDVNHVAQNTDIKVYPNPAKDVLYINTSDAKATLALYSITGQQVAQQSLQAGNNKVELSALSAGSYFVNITANGQTLHRQTIQVVK